MSENKPQEYGEIKFSNKHIVHVLGGKATFKIPIEEVKIIGEFTNSDGPFFDDWFITFITKKECHEIPIYVEGMNELLQDLGNQLNCKLDYQFANSATWKTRIIFPENLKDKELYNIVYKKPKALLKKVFGIKEYVREFSIEVRTVLNAQST